MEVIDYINLNILGSNKERRNKLLELINTYNIVRNGPKGVKFIIKTKKNGSIFKFLAKIAYNEGCALCPLRGRSCWISISLDWWGRDHDILDQCTKSLCNFKPLNEIAYKSTDKEPRFKEELE